MQGIRNFRLATRMSLGFGSVLALLAAVALVGVFNFNAFGRMLDEVFGSAWAKAQAVAKLEAGTRANAMRTLELVLAADAQRQAFLRERIAANRKDVEASLQTLQERVYVPQAKALLADIVGLRQRYVQGFSAVDAAVAAGRRKQAEEIVDAQVVPVLDEMLTKVRALAQIQNDIVATSSASVKTDLQRALTLMIALGLGALALGSVFAWWLTRSVTQPVAQAVKLAGEVAAGNLSVRIQADGRDEIAELLQTLQRMTQHLAGVVGSVRGNAESVATASAQIAQGTQDLSQRTEEQASALQQTAASMEQLSATVKHNADNARQANQLAQGASEVAQRGGQAVERVVQTMQGIHDGSRRIADIIGTIDGISFQTNILALNAAVEAARAGEQGRGFAVVAGEVRTLAQRAAEAAREIKMLIGASVEQVESGNALVGEAGRTMQEVVQAIRSVSDIVGEISSASAEQSGGVAQIGQAVGQMDQVTQQNAALVEESAAAADSLRMQAGQLVDVVAVFRLDADPAAAGAAPAAGPAPAARPAARPAPAPQPRRAAAPKSARATLAAAKAETAEAAETADWQSF